MLATHPRIVRNAFVLLGTIVFDSRNHAHVRRALDIIRKLDLKPDTDYTFEPSVTVQTPCPLTPFKGKHIPHREFMRGDTGESVYVHYLFPRYTRTSEVKAWFEANGLRYEAEQCYHSYDCCANWYCHGWSIKAGRRHIVATISYGMNV